MTGGSAWLAARKIVADARITVTWVAMTSSATYPPRVLPFGLAASVSHFNIAPTIYYAW